MSNSPAYSFPAHSAKQPTRPPPSAAMEMEQFPKRRPLHVRLRSRVRGLYLHADDDWAWASSCTRSARG
jgi:hypothetical protein